MLIDTHAHIYSEYYDDIEEVIKQSNSNHVDIIINSGVDGKTNKEILALSKKHSNIYITLGVHPENANNYTLNDIKYIEDNLNNKNVVAIGEIGLDYHYENYNKEEQIKLFEIQLDLAQKYNVPVVIHSREATLDTINILKKYSLKGVIHSFSGSYEVALEYIKMGFKLGINGVVTFKNAHIKEVIKKIGLEHFVLETDSPYLTPTPLRGKINYPGYINLIADFLSDYLCVSKNEIASITSKNVTSTFDKISL